MNLARPGSDISELGLGLGLGQTMGDNRSGEIEIE